MDEKSGRRLLLRKLALSGAFVVASAIYVTGQAGRPLTPAVVTAVGTPTTAPPSDGVRIGTRQTVQVKDEDFQGGKYDARFGPVRVKITVDGGRIVSVRAVEYPDHSPTSVKINLEALPRLEQEAIAAQSAVVDAVSGATLTSKAWAHSLRSAIRAAART